MPPRIITTIGSSELGLPPGTLGDLDAEVAKLPKEQLIRRTITVLHALNADRDHAYARVNASFLEATAGESALRLANALARGDSTFFDPWQQLLILRRAMAQPASTPTDDLYTSTGFDTYVDVCRLAADVLVPAEEFPDAGDQSEKWLHVAAGFMPRLWLTTPVNPNHWIARRRIMLDRLPSIRSELRVHAENLKSRYPDATGLAYDEVSRLVEFMSYASLAPTLEDLFSPAGAIGFRADTFLRDTDVSREALETLLLRIGRPWNETIDDSSFGGPVSILPFRDRPFICFDDGTFAPVMRELVLEKLTADVFWWLKDPDAPQTDLWQREWGYLFQGYCGATLERVAQSTGCGFKSPVVWDGGEMDAALWFNGHVALFEITASGISDADAHTLDATRLGLALGRAFVESGRKGKVKQEAIGQLARDIDALVRGVLQDTIPVAPSSIQRVYPVMLGADRRVRTPGVWYHLADRLVHRLGPVADSCAALAVLGIEDLDDAEQLLADEPHRFQGMAPGMLRLLQRWDADRGPAAPSWWQFVETIARGIRPNRFLVEEAECWRMETERHFIDRSHRDPPNKSPMR